MKNEFVVTEEGKTCWNSDEQNRWQVGIAADYELNSLSARSPCTSLFYFTS